MDKNNNTKKAFTIAEALVCFVLIGIIFVASLGVLDRKTEYTQLYYQAFNILLQASKSIQQSNCAVCQNNCEQEETCYAATCWRGNNGNNSGSCKKQEREYPGGTNNIGRDFPGTLFIGNNNEENMLFALSGSGGDETFCEKLIEKINTAPGANCRSFISLINEEKLGLNSKNGGVVFSDAFPASIYDKENKKYTPLEEDGKILNIAPSFIASNGQRFYISRVVTANFQTKNKGKKEISNFKHGTRESYRFVVVDLNGKSLPNSQFKSGEIYPDLVLFVINSMGDVIPLGMPEFSKNYINAFVHYPNGKKSERMKLFDAKKYAWGIDGEHPLETSTPFNSPISDFEPLSQSSKLYTIAIECKGKSCSAKNTDEKELYADDLFVNIMLQFMYKNEHSTEYFTEDFTITNVFAAQKERGCIPITRTNMTPTCGIDFEH